MLSTFFKTYSVSSIYPGCFGENPLRFLQAFDANAFASFLCSTDRMYRLFGAVALGNVAATRGLQEKVLEAGALDLLIKVKPCCHKWLLSLGRMSGGFRSALFDSCAPQ